MYNKRGVSCILCKTIGINSCIRKKFFFTLLYFFIHFPPPPSPYFLHFYEAVILSWAEILPCRGYLARSGDVFGCHDEGMVLLASSG